MRHHIVRTIAFITLSLGLAGTASAQGHHACSIARVSGTWGYSLQGTFFPPTPTGPATVLVAFVGTFTVDADGDLEGTQTSNANGTVSHDVLKGKLTVNPDCTGTQTVDIYDVSGKVLQRSAVWAVVFLDDAREVRGTFESLKLPNGTIVPAIAIADGKKAGRL